MVSMRGKLVCLEGPSVCSPRCCQEGALLIIGIRLYLLQMFSNPTQPLSIGQKIPTLQGQLEIISRRSSENSRIQVHSSGACDLIFKVII
jgi:hypothetical protein